MSYCIRSGRTTKIEAKNANGVGKMDVKLEMELEVEPKLEREVEGVAASFD